MKTNLFIPSKLRVGFQKRADTFTKKLAYVIYYDEKGKIRKETSWQQWRHKDIDVLELDNDPQIGFTLNKGIQRYSDWGNGRSVVRVWDPRDFEFEISVDNLLGILMHSDVSKRDIQQDCVFAWYGTELVLLPTNCDEYQQSVKHTEKQAMKFSAKSLVQGYTYTKKKDTSSMMYLGFYNTYKEVRDYENESRIWEDSGKKHWFIDTQYIDKHYGCAETKTAAVFSNAEIEETHTSYADEFQKLYRSTNISRPVGLVEGPPENAASKGFFIKVGENTYGLYTLKHHNSDQFSFDRLYHFNNGKLLSDHHHDRSYYYYNRTVKDYVTNRFSPNREEMVHKLISYQTGIKKSSYYFTNEEKDQLNNWVKENITEAVMLHYKLDNGETSIKGILE